MALFKIAKGPESGLEQKEIHEGYCYVAHDNKNHYYFYVDV